MPAVRSAVVRLAFRPPPAAVPDQDAFETMVRSMFMQRRKTLSNALRPFAESVGHEASAALASAGIDSRRRPETLQPAELARLADVFGSKHKAVL